MNRMLPIGLALALFAAVEAAPCRAQSVNSGVRDRAHLFSSEAARQAELALQTIEREDHWQVLVETIDSLNGQDAHERAIADAKDRKIQGLLILVSKNDHKVWTQPSESARKVFSGARTQEIRDRMAKAFKAGDFDEGLREAVAVIQKDVAAAASPTAAGSVKVGVRDQAKMFSPEAVQKANQALQALQRETRWQVVVETVDSLDGQTARDRAIADAEKQGPRGLIILVSKNPHKIAVEPSHSTKVVFSKERAEAIAASLSRSFKEGKFDQGLLAAVAEVRKDAGVAPELTETGKEAAPKKETTGDQPASATAPEEATPKENAKEKESAESKPAPVTALTDRAEKQAPSKGAPLAASAPAAAPAPEEDQKAFGEPAPRQGSNVLPLILLGVGVLVFLWLLSRVFRRPRQPAYGGPAPGMGGQPQPVEPPVGPAPAPGYGPAPRPPAPPAAKPGYAPGVPPTASPGYGPAGPPVANSGYPAGGYGYGAPPPPQSPGGGFMSGALGGLGGAIVGNILYDKFGHPHPASEAPPTGSVYNTGGMAPPVHPGGEVVPPAPSETYNPDTGAVADWGGGPEQGQPTGEWSGTGDAGAEADWSSGGTQEAASESPAGGEWSETGDAGAVADWGTEGGASGEGAGAEADWGGSEEPAGTDDSAGTDWSGGDDGGGGDWGGDDDQSQGGSW
jgi:uncharacterized membrane protein YgcG